MPAETMIAKKTAHISSWKLLVESFLESMGDLKALKKEYVALGYAASLADGDFTGTNNHMTKAIHDDSVASFDALEALLAAFGNAHYTNLYSVKRAVPIAQSRPLDDSTGIKTSFITRWKLSVSQLLDAVEGLKVMRTEYDALGYSGLVQDDFVEANNHLSPAQFSSSVNSFDAIYSLLEAGGNAHFASLLKIRRLAAA